nr:DUF3572 domain-containing protein [uncultured Cohaesibacter sp.]
MQKKQSGISFESAESLGIQALGFLSNDSELLGRFLSLSGLEPGNIREVASEPSFLAAVLDFLLNDDSLILAFASNNAIDPEDVVAAKVKLDPMSMATTGSL